MFSILYFSALVALLAVLATVLGFRVAHRANRNGGVIKKMAEFLAGFWSVLRPGAVLFAWFLVACALLAELAATARVAGVVIWLAIVCAAVELLLQRRANRSVAFFQAIATAAEKNMPLEPVVKSFATEFGGSLPKLVLSRLRQGRSLGEAISETKRRAPGGCSYLLRVGERVGSASKALKKMLPRDDAWGKVIATLYFGAAALLLGSAIVAFIFIKILPSFKKIAIDFGMPMPFPWRFWDFLGLNVVLLAVPPLLLAVALFSLLRNWGALWLELPGERWFTGPSRKAEVFECLALAAEKDRPLDDVLGILAAEYPYLHTRSKLIYARSCMRRGDYWVDALRSSGAISAFDAQALSSAERAGNLAWVLDMLADRNRRLLRPRAKIVQNVLFALYLLTLGSATAFIAAGVFAFLVQVLKTAQ